MVRNPTTTPVRVSHRPRGKETRLRLMQAAVSHFAMHGFQGASLRSIAEDAGIAFQNTKYYFGSKEQLWVAAVDHVFEEITATVATIDFDPAGDVDAQVRAFLRGAFSGHAAGGALRRIFTQEYFEDSERYHKLLKPRIAGFMHASTALFQQLHRLWPAPLLSMREMQLLFNGMLAATTVMGYEIASLTKHPIGHPKTCAVLVELLLSVFAEQGSRPRQSAARRAERKPPRRPRATAMPAAPEASDAPVKLLAAAIDVFARHGYRGSSLRTIAERAGISFQLIRYHFGSKEELWTASLTQLLDRRIGALRTYAIDPNGDIGEQLRSWLTRAIVFTVEEPQLRKILAREYFRRSEQHENIIKPKVDEFQRLLLRTYEQMLSLGAILGITPRDAQLLVGSVVNTNAVMPYETELTVGAPVTDAKNIEFQVGLLMKVLTRGRMS